ncbi:hypothetical protein T484DRAFT_1873916, partial [Baffinella frigidus]
MALGGSMSTSTGEGAMGDQERRLQDYKYTADSRLTEIRDLQKQLVDLQTKGFTTAAAAAAALHEPSDRKVVESPEYQSLLEQFKALKKESETTQ